MSDARDELVNCTDDDLTLAELKERTIDAECDGDNNKASIQLDKTDRPKNTLTRRRILYLSLGTVGTVGTIAIGLKHSRPPTVVPISNLLRFSFNSVKLNSKGEIIDRPSGTATYFSEDLANETTLEMVRIPGGTFTMGAFFTMGPNKKEEEEEGASYNESPQHQVTLKEFWMGKFVVTQEQWRAIARLPKVNVDLESDPSTFKGDKLPVVLDPLSREQAKEFCDRLSRKTGKAYTLPTEAQWEYACRAGTTTPFHFGETITTDVANFDGFNGDYSVYGKASKGTYRKKTIAVDSFDPNAFGLYNMHGNVWELCLDSWHDTYTNAPDDGSAWDPDGYGIMRGGCWVDVPVSCRSAARRWSGTGYSGKVIGFRVVYSSTASSS